jgi:hypothetical protein
LHWGRGGCDVPFDESPHRISAEPVASGAGEQGVGGVAFSLVDPGAEHSSGLASQRCDPFFSSLASAAHVAAAAEVQ